MFRVIACLTDEHDLRLVVLAGLICTGAMLAAFYFLARARTSAAGQRAQWLVAAGAAAGGGVWATHFVAMLAYDGVLPIRYGQLLTIVSAAIGIGAAYIAFTIAAQSGRARLAAAPMFAAGVAAMHFTGMAAMQTPARVAYDLGMVAAGFVVGVLLSGAAMAAARSHNPRVHIGAAAVLLTLGICAMHFVAMSALTLTPDPGIAFSTDSTPAGVLIAEVVAAVIFGVASFAAINSRDSRRLRGLVNASLEGIVIADGDHIIHVNDAMLHLSGLTHAELARGLAALLPELAAAAAAAQAGTVAVETVIAHRTGAAVPVELVIRDFEGSSGRARVFTVRDLSERRAALARIEHLAHHDQLTSLPNRALFNDRLAQAIAVAARDGGRIALIYLDLDGFKTINDLYGHGEGDLVLRSVADLLATQVRASDTVARLGGDEFAIVQTGVSSVADARDLGARILAAFEAKFGGDTSDRSIGVSMGIAFYPDDGREPEVLQRNADTALYRSKAAGRGSWHFFTQAMDAGVLDRRAFERDLRSAIALGEMYLVYQPQADSGTGEITGFEALLRWRHPVRGAVPPDEFIPVAEGCGYILQIGRWVLGEACREAATWANPLRIAVNVSPIQFLHSDVAAVVEKALAVSGLAAGRLEIEITESALLGDGHATLAALRRLRLLGVRVAMDDFGTGYSSLSNLQSFPFDKIKIDRSFVSKIEDSESAATIVRAIIGLGRGLRLPITAEGVETAFQRSFLQAEDCTEMQGYLIGKPQLIEAFAELTTPPVAARVA